MNNASLITKREYGLVAVWAAAVLVFYAVVCVMGVGKLNQYKAETAAKRGAWLESTAKPPGDVGEGAVTSEGTRPVDVNVGIVMNEIGEFQIRNAGWVADFDIWFRWLDERVHPGESFRIVNGQVETCERTVAETQGGQHYERYHVRARIQKVFDPARYPFATEALGIQVEDPGIGAKALRYVTDEGSSRVAQTALPPVLRLVKTLSFVYLEEQQTEGSDSGVGGKAGQARPRFSFLLLVAPIVGTHYIAIFQALFASVAIALLVFFIKPTHVDPRFGLGVGAFFAAVGSNAAIVSGLPQVDRVTLVNIVNGLGLLTVFLTLVQSTISLYIFDTLGRERLSRLFDYVSVAVILPCYVVVNVVLPRAAAM